MRVAKVFLVIRFLLAFLCFFGCSKLSADDRDIPRLELKQLTPQVVDHEVTVVFRCIGTGGISQRFEEGKTSTFALEPEKGDNKKEFKVWIGGDLAEIVDRFGFGHGVPKIPAGTIIEVTGKFDYRKRNNVEYYSLQVDDWKKFRILSYPAAKSENAQPQSTAPSKSKQR